MMSKKLQRVQDIFNNIPIYRYKNKYPYSFFSLTDFNTPVDPKIISDIADLIIKKIKISDIDIVVSEADRGGGPIAQEVARKIKKPFVLANWYPEKIKEGVFVKTKVGFSGEGYVYLLGVTEEQNILVVDDLISSGGTLNALIKGIRKVGANIIDIVCVGEKVEQKGVEMIKNKYNINVKSLVKFSALGNYTKIIKESSLKKDYWLSDKSKKYNSFNIQIPSEVVAYKMVYELAKVKGKKVLDYGCYIGNSSLMILNMGAKSVLGVDSSLESITESHKKTNKKLTFLHVEKEDNILVDSKFDVCTSTFVHPVINSKEELLRSFRKINNVLKKDGIFIILGLNPRAFKKEYDFKYYDFNKKKSHSDMKDGDIFKNNLYLPDGTILELKDVYWSEDALTEIMCKSGFEIKEVVNLKGSELSGKYKDIFDKLKSDIAFKHDISWMDEWKAPLYQIIIAKNK